MSRSLILPCLIFVLVFGAYAQRGTIQVRGLQATVEILRDENGVNHIYAQNEYDLFFAQGYCAAKDRLFQFEIWRRQATGTVAEILGSRELKRDIGARLFQYRGNLEEDFNRYHPRGSAIIQAFTDGVNACIGEAVSKPESLPLEFKLLGIQPQMWKPADVISRHQGLLGNVQEEVQYARWVMAVGEQKLKEIRVFEPGEPRLSLDPSIVRERLNDPILELYDAFRKPLSFAPEDMRTSANTRQEKFDALANSDYDAWASLKQFDPRVIGSNNWVVSGRLTERGAPILANDPHRALTTPSLRYLVHLHAPGWNVLGGGEPTIPGVSIGHNEFGAWGLTIFSIDAEDLYVYDLNPLNPNQYRYKGAWEDMTIIPDTIQVKGNDKVVILHRYTRHGPVTYHDEKHRLAYAVRCGWLEPGSAPYLASLRMNQATSWEEFREACTYSFIPGENMIWADRAGNIGWQAVGVAPVRKNWDGLVPVPGDGRYEWEGYLPIKSLPHVFNPEQGFWATANENLIPRGYPNRDAVGWGWAEPFRAQRIHDVLSRGSKKSLRDMMQLQFDYVSVPAKTLVPLLRNVIARDAETEQARQRLLNWNFAMDVNSVAASIYLAWEKQLNRKMAARIVPAVVQKQITTVPTTRLIQWLTEDGKVPGDRNEFIEEALYEAVQGLREKWGADMSRWTYGRMHYALIKHPFSNAVNEVTRKKLDVGPLPRGGYGFTPGMTTHNENQNAGASFRMVVDVSDWEQCMFTQCPGQSGDPASPFYQNLFRGWAEDRHFQVHFSRAAIDKVTKTRTVLRPGK